MIQYTKRWSYIDKSQEAPLFGFLMEKDNVLNIKLIFANYECKIVR